MGKTMDWHDWLNWLNEQKAQDWLNLWGLLVNFIGTAMIAMSIGRDRSGLHTFDRGRVTYMAAVNHPRILKFGVVIVALGFLLQFAAQSCHLGLCPKID